MVNVFVNPGCATVVVTAMMEVTKTGLSVVIQKIRFYSFRVLYFQFVFGVDEYVHY
jgi:hypothetical protein